MSFSIYGEWVYEGILGECAAYDERGLRELFGFLEIHRQRGFCVGFVSYEAHLALSHPHFRSQEPLAYFQVFARRRPYCSAPSCQDGIDAGSPKLESSALDSKPYHQPKPPKIPPLFYPTKPRFISQESYSQKLLALKEQIAEGNTYQGNLVSFLEFESFVDGLSIFETLIQRQDTAYKAFLSTPFGEIISCSPELFFSIDSCGQILCKPMKGTVRRGKDAKEDAELKSFLAQDPKNRSENVMIVDLLRNDLSKIVEQGSLEVSKLFEVEGYPTLFQMTSSIEGRLRRGVGLYEIFEALFPCGSITGAPKENTIQILRELEEGRERGVYCGALGVVDAEGATFSIPIRTICKRGERCLYGVGSGVVWDSQPEEEYAELQTKMRFLYGARDFHLLETLLYTPESIEQEFLRLEGGLVFLEEHLQRLECSARDLGFVWEDSLPLALTRGLTQTSEGCSKPCILRVLLSAKGEVEIERRSCEPILGVQGIRLEEKAHRGDLDAYKIDRKRADLGSGIFDLLYHRDGILLEGSRSNLVLEIDGELWTPKAEGEILRGVCREVLMRRGILRERVLRIEDLERAKRIFCINSVRGFVRVNVL